MKVRCFWIARITQQIFVMSDTKVNFKKVALGYEYHGEMFHIGSFIQRHLSEIGIGEQKKFKLTEIRGEKGE